MKKILLLGGSAQQVVAIETAKRLGFYTILCDYLTDNPGQYIADKFYLVSTTDREAVLKVAEEEHVDGVLAHASDPAAPTAAYISEKLGLPGLPLEATEILCNKYKFRKFLSENGFNSPRFKEYNSVNELVEESRDFHFPVMVKPVDSSGSKGAALVYEHGEMEEAAQNAISHSRCQKIIVEEYIQMNHPFLVGGDIFVDHGQVILWGLMNCHRDSSVNALVPAGKSYPPILDKCDLDLVKETLQKIVDLLHIQTGALNVELIVDKDHNVWPVDMGPRSGGNMIPELLSFVFETDTIEMSVKAAMGIPLNPDIKTPTSYYATHNLHSNQNGIFQGIQYSDVIKEHIVRECVYKNIGDNVEYFDDAGKVLGIIFMKFDDQSDMMNILQGINNQIHIKIENSGGVVSFNYPLMVITFYPFCRRLRLEHLT